jgi:predicted phosphate transport protein (TIGR00153 family)
MSPRAMMLKRLLPKETSFFDFFERHTKLTIEACKELDAIAANPSELRDRVARIKELEHEADDITHECIEALHRTFITPIDRADIHRLMKRLDDIIDSVDSAASRMLLYDIQAMRPEMKQFTVVLMRASAEIDGAIAHFRNMNRGADAIGMHCRGIYDAENQGDQILRSALQRLFNEEKEPIHVIKWKEIFERLEKATDRCEEVANIVQGVVIEAS